MSKPIRLVMINGRPRVGSMWAFNVTRALAAMSGLVVKPGAVPALPDEIAGACRQAMADADERALWVLKDHSLVQPHSAVRCIVPRRDPRDAAVSLMRFSNVDFETFLRRSPAINQVEAHYKGMADDLRLFLPYPMIENDPKTLCRAVCGFLDLRPESEAIAHIVRNYAKPNVARHIDALDTADASENRHIRDIAFTEHTRRYDTRSGFQSGHVSNYQDGDWEGALSGGQIARLNDALAASIDDWEAYIETARDELERWL